MAFVKISDSETTKGWYMEHVLNFEQNSLGIDGRNASRHLIQQFRLRENIVKAGIMINGAEYERAIETLNDVLMDDPNNTDALNDLTTAYILNGNSIKAMSTIFRVLELTPDDEFALEKLSYLKNRSVTEKRSSRK